MGERLRKYVPGRRPSKHKEAEAGMSGVACSKKGKRAVWLQHRKQDRAAQDEIRKDKKGQVI